MDTTEGESVTFTGPMDIVSEANPRKESFLTLHRHPEAVPSFRS